MSLKVYSRPTGLYKLLALVFSHALLEVSIDEAVDVCAA